MITSIILFILGFVILIAGANFLVRGASLLGKKLKIPALVIGIVIVGFGTSTPEMVVSVFAAIKGSAEIAISNVVGSNIVNIMLILGIMPFMMVVKAVNQKTVKIQIPLVILTSLVLFFVTNEKMFFNKSENTVTQLDGIIFLLLFIGYILYTLFIDKSSKKDEIIDVNQKTAIILLMIFSGIAGVYFGGNFVVENAIEIAKYMGISEAFIGVSILAVGTSLPEIISSITAAVKKEEGIALGNIIGSNIFNTFLILGIASLIMPLNVSDAQQFNIFINIIASFLFLLFVLAGKRNYIFKILGGIYILLYLSFLIYSYYLA